MKSEPIDKLQGADVCTIVDHPQLRGYQHHIITHIGLNPEDEDISQVGQKFDTSEVNRKLVFFGQPKVMNEVPWT